VIADLERSKYQMVRANYPMHSSASPFHCSFLSLSSIPLAYRLQAEYRVSIYGRSLSEFPRLAEWFMTHKMASPNVTWLIQVPRLLYVVPCCGALLLMPDSNVYAGQGQVKTFADLLRNIFEPLFEATLHPERHPVMAEFMTHICGFDSVDDESKPDRHPFNSQSVLVI
jgi:AMP deaminase